jgi:hypothetical protein
MGAQPSLGHLGGNRVVPLTARDADDSTGWDNEVFRSADAGLAELRWYG